MAPSPQPSGARAQPTPWIALALLALTQLRLWPAWSGWHKDDDFRNLRWALAYREAPWKALTELTPVHQHIRPATLWGHWLGAHLGDGSWAGIHAVHVALCTGTVLGLFLLGERLFGWREGLLAALTFLLLPGMGELPWWNAWMCSAGEVTFGLLALVMLHRSLEAGRWPVLPLALCALAGLFKEPGWVLYPLAAAALALQHLRRDRDPRHWAALLLFPALGLLGLAMSYHPENLARSAEEGNFVTALGKLIDPLLTAAPDAGGGLALPLPLLALGLLARGGARGPALWVGTALCWAAGLGLGAAQLSTGWLLVVGLPALIALACWQWWRGAQAPTDLLLAGAGIAVMAPFPFPHPVQMLGGLAGLCIALAAGWMRVERGRWPLLAAGVLAMGASWARQEQPVDGEFPSQVSAHAKVQLLDAIGFTQSRGVFQARVLDPPDDRSVVLALGGLQPLRGTPALILDGVALPQGQAPEDLLATHTLPRTNLRHRAQPGSHPLFDLEPGTYVLSAKGSAQTRGTWVEVYGACGAHELGPSTSAQEQALVLHVDKTCALELRADTRAPQDVRLSSVPAAKLSYRAADPYPQLAFFENLP